MFATKRTSGNRIVAKIFSNPKINRDFSLDFLQLTVNPICWTFQHWFNVDYWNYKWEGIKHKEVRIKLLIHKWRHAILDHFWHSLPSLSSRFSLIHPLLKSYILVEWYQELILIKTLPNLFGLSVITTEVKLRLYLLRLLPFSLRSFSTLDILHIFL